MFVRKALQSIKTKARSPSPHSEWQHQQPLLFATTILTPSRYVSSSHHRQSASGGSSSKKRRGGRHFAYRKNEKAQIAQAKHEKKKSRQSASHHIPAPKAASHHQGAPPALLAPTGSPHVFVSKMALLGEGDNDNLEAVSMAQTLFENYTELPRTFEEHQFEYLSPQTLQFEYPVHGQTEIAFLGRSNVGKSSLVNALMRRNLCQTSKSPGRTQLPYYYGLFPKRLLNDDLEKKKSNTTTALLQPGHALGYVVDLPGYGYGMAPKQVVEEWQAKTQEWLLDRRDAGVLKRLFLLVDARRGDEGPSKLDQTVMEWAEDAEIPFSVVLTKADRVSVPKVVKQVNDLCTRYATRHGEGTFQSPMIHVTSASKHWGIHELLESIEVEFSGTENEEVDDDEDVDSPGTT